MILVTGATGRVGHHLVEDLIDAHAPAVAMVRVEARAFELPPAIDHVIGTLDDPPPSEVLRRFDRVFLMSPRTEHQEELEITFVDALVAAGHRPHVVKLAADGFQDPDCDVRFMRSHGVVARHLAATGLPVTHIAPAMFMEYLLDAADEVRDEAEISAPVGHGRVGFIAARDVGAAAAAVLTSDLGARGDDDVLVLTGPESLSHSAVARKISTVFARKVVHADKAPPPPPDPWLRAGMDELYGWIRSGGAAPLSQDVQTLTGEPPRSLERWLAGARAAFLGRPRTVSAPRVL